MQHPTTRSYISTPASARATEAAEMAPANAETEEEAVIHILIIKGM